MTRPQALVAVALLTVAAIAVPVASTQAQAAAATARGATADTLARIQARVAQVPVLRGQFSQEKRIADYERQHA